MFVLSGEPSMTVAQIKEKLKDASKDASTSVALFLNESFLPDSKIIGEILPKSSSRSLELHALPKTKCWLQVFGFPEKRIPFEVPGILNPASVKAEIQEAVQTQQENFRLILDGCDLDLETSFKDQGLVKDAEIVVDIRVELNIHFPDSDETRTVECFTSDLIGDLRQNMELPDDMILVSSSPNRQVLEDTQHLCSVTRSSQLLEAPITLIAEKKVLLNFRLLMLENCQRKLLVALSCTPLDIFDLLSEQFRLKSEFRLCVNGEVLNTDESLANQLQNINDVIDIDILRSFMISSLWDSPLNLKHASLYCSESLQVMFEQHERNNQKVFFNGLSLDTSNSVVRTLGPTNDKESSVFFIERDEERSIPVLTSDGTKVFRRLAWAKDDLLSVLRNIRDILTKEVTHDRHQLTAKSPLNKFRLTEDTLVITDPKKMVIRSGGKLQIRRSVQKSTIVKERTQTEDDQVDDSPMDQKLDKDIHFRGPQTKVAVKMNDSHIECSFHQPQVSFNDVILSVGEQLKIPPRHLFSKILYCTGCRRKLSQKEEEHQPIPANCCRTKSLQLMDCRTIGNLIMS